MCALCNVPHSEGPLIGPAPITNPPPKKNTFCLKFLEGFSILRHRLGPVEESAMLSLPSELLHFILCLYENLERSRSVSGNGKSWSPCRKKLTFHLFLLFSPSQGSSL